MKRNLASSEPKKTLFRGAKASFALRFLLEFHILRVYGKGLEGAASTLIEFGKQLYILKPVGMHICAEHVDRHIERVPDNKNEEEQNALYNRILRDRAQQVYHLPDHAGCKPQCQQAGIGQYVAKVAGGRII